MVVEPWLAVMLMLVCHARDRILRADPAAAANPGIPVPNSFRNPGAFRSGRRQGRSSHLRDVGCVTRKMNQAGVGIIITRSGEEGLSLRRHLLENLVRHRVGACPGIDTTNNSIAWPDCHWPCGSECLPSCHRARPCKRSLRTNPGAMEIAISISRDTSTSPAAAGGHVR